MMSMGPDRRQEFFSAIHIQHVLDVIPKDDIKPKPLRQLRTWLDPLPPSGKKTTGSIDALRYIDSSLGGEVNYGAPLAQRYADYLDRVEKRPRKKPLWNAACPLASSALTT